MSADPAPGSTDRAGAPATRRRRVLLAKTALDGHWRGLSLVARALRDDGFEVVLLGMATDAEIARAAADEDVDLVGLNVGGRIEVVERIITAVRNACAGVPIVAGGAIAPWAAERLDAAGVESYPPGSALDDIVAAARRLTGLEPAARLHRASESGEGGASAARRG